MYLFAFFNIKIIITSNMWTFLPAAVSLVILEFDIPINYHDEHG